MIKNLTYSLIALMLTVLASCTKGDRLDQINDAAAAPQQISDVKVKEGPGSAEITYSLPSDPNLSYVKAIYEIRPGVFREARSSRYTDTLLLVGFADVQSHEVKIYSVGKNEKASEPIVINVVPHTPPVQSVFETLDIVPTFGGVSIRFKNELKANLVISILMDSLGNKIWLPVNDFYTGAPEGSFSVRGFNTNKKKFAVLLKDRWNNQSDTLVKDISPLFEEQIDRRLIKGLKLPTDAIVLSPSNDVGQLFNGVYGNTDVYGTVNASVFPQWFTFDFGQKVIISRFKTFQRGAPFTYSLSAVKSFEIYATNAPASDGSWTGWNLLGKFESFKPSGLPMGQTNDADVNYASVKGEDFEFDDLLPAYRYIRFKTLETWDMGGQVAIAELAFWGRVEK